MKLQLLKKWKILILFLTIGFITNNFKISYQSDNSLLINKHVTFNDSTINESKSQSNIDDDLNTTMDDSDDDLNTTMDYSDNDKLDNTEYNKQNINNQLKQKESYSNDEIMDDELFEDDEEKNTLSNTQKGVVASIITGGAGLIGYGIVKSSKDKKKSKDDKDETQEILMKVDTNNTKSNTKNKNEFFKGHKNDNKHMQKIEDMTSNNTLYGHDNKKKKEAINEQTAIMYQKDNNGEELPQKSQQQFMNKNKYQLQGQSQQQLMNIKPYQSTQKYQPPHTIESEQLAVKLVNAPSTNSPYLYPGVLDVSLTNDLSSTLITNNV